jgi:hypothetical protein
MPEPRDAIAERAREEREEREYDAEYKGADALPDLSDQRVSYPAKLVRDWVRSVLVAPAIKRLHDIGHGVQTFDTPTMAGNVVRIEAHPSVQVKALATLVAIGIPTQMGIVDGDGNTLPGVLALGPLDLDAARQQAHGERYVSPEMDARLRAGVRALTNGTNGGVTGDPSQELPPPMSERIKAGEFQMVEVEEGVGTDVRNDVDHAPGPIPEHETTEQRILRQRRARRNGK